jgi:large subunit ribosomal protein L22
MEIKAKARFIRISPRKVRLVVDVIRGKNVNDALARLEFLNKGAVLPVKKVLLSAIANAKHNLNIEKENLYIKTVTVDEGPKFKRYMPKAHGRATVIRKRTSHINLLLAEIVETPVKGVKTKSVKKEKVVAITAEDKKSAVKKAVENGKGKVEAADGVKPEIFDVRMKGKHRNKQHQDVKKRENKKFLHKLFNRKSGM